MPPGSVHTTVSPCASGCSGGEEARLLLVPESGAQRASLHRSVRLTVLAVAFALVAAIAATNPNSTSAASIKVVIVVGPAGSNTANYITNAKRYATQARG